MARSAAYRKYQITINNPADKGFTHDIIRDILSGLSSCLYWCMCDEIGHQGTPHTHVYVAFKNAVMFQTMQQRFYGAHIEDARGDTPRKPATISARKASTAKRIKPIPTYPIPSRNPVSFPPNQSGASNSQKRSSP